MKNTHTHGPWHTKVFQAPNGPEFHIYHECEEMGLAEIAVVNADLLNDEANARLIAAAPDLLEVLKLTAGFLTIDPWGMSRRDYEDEIAEMQGKVVEVIRKAKGHQYE